MVIPKGALVEATLEGEHYAKHFNIGHVAEALYNDKGDIIDHHALFYHAPFSFSLEGMPLHL